MLRTTSMGERKAGRYGAMTVNERFFVAGLLNDFDQAVGVKNIDTLRRILCQVELSGENIDAILDRMLPGRSHRD